MRRRPLLAERPVTDTNPELPFALTGLVAFLHTVPFLPAAVAVPLFILGLLSLTVCRRLVLTHARLELRRPLLCWLGFASQRIPIEEISRARADGGRLELRVRGLRRRIWIGSDAERFAGAVQAEVRRVRRGDVREREAQVADAVRVRPAAQAQVLCPYCHDDLHWVEVACGGCATGYHAECLSEHGRCAILGCGSVRARRAA